MEIVSRPARRYAQAFLDWVRSQGVLDSVREDAAHLRELIKGMSPLRLFLGNYLIPQAIRRSALAELFEGRLHPATLRLVGFLEFKKRLGLLNEILLSFEQKEERLRGVVRGQVVWAQPVERAVERLVEVWTAAQFPAKELRIESRVDATLIGGLTIRVDDLFWDGSVAGGLRRIRRRLESPLPDRG